MTTKPQQPQRASASDSDTASDKADSLQAQLAAMGSESPAQRTANRVVPWLFTVALHAAIIALGFVITWSVVMNRDDDEHPVIVADFDAMSFDPVAMLDAAPTTTADELIAPSPLDVDETAVDEPFERVAEPIELDDMLQGPQQDVFAPPPVQGSASFLGVSTSNAQRVVFVIDASGTMIPYLPIVVKELAKSLDQLTEQQEFSIVFFQRNDAMLLPPQRRLVPANAQEIVRALDWIDEQIVPAGRSNPLPAFRAALRMKPDVIFVLSQNITGSGIYEVDQEEVLATLDQLNPVDRLTDRRAVQINCIQFLDPDPLDTLRMIAEEHGGPRAYKFLSRAELGLATRTP